jgi:2',3'-cyclic-nucleotide 2'-phosphodiesterase (5'-nucleotidase family)
MENQLSKIKIISCLLFFYFASAIQAFPQNKITVVYTNSLNGHLDDCGCKESPNGGLVMRAEEIKKIRASYENVFLFETGDFFASESDELLAEYLIKSYKYIGYDAISIGDQELSGGIENIIKYSGELPFVCNNISLQSGGEWKTVFKRYLIIEKNNIKAGIIGTISNNAFKYYTGKITKQIKILDQVKEINDDIKALKAKGVKLIFLLSHSGFEEDILLAKKLKGIDLIIGGHSQTLVNEPGGNAPVILQAGADGARIGILELSLKDKTKIIRNAFRLPHLPLSKENSIIRKYINEYNAKVKEAYKKMKLN